MENKYSFWQLLNSTDFSKIEIPILQRDYAQGRNTPDASRIRKQFSDYLIKALCNDTPIELDFVYGSIEKQSYKESEENKNVFIPLDGQQRLTTLFLLHWYLAAKEEKLTEKIKEKMRKFSYETRPSAHDFCKKLISNANYSENLKTDITDASWYIDEWDNDPTVKGMLIMLDTFQNNKTLKMFTDENANISFFDKLINDESGSIITFYFVSLEKFGLTEKLYIRMNARGKMLNDFENFKSEFYKIIRCHQKQFDIFKDKIEYGWVELLWDFRDKKKFIVDKAFMNYLRFITEMLYFKQSQVKAESYESFYKDEPINFDVLKDIFSNENNLSFLIFSFDNICLLRKRTEDIFWLDKNKSLCKITENVLNEENIDISSQIVLYAALLYLYKTNKTKIDEDDNFFDFIRVIRNLIHNTSDKSRREWANILKSIEYLIGKDTIYTTLVQPETKNLLVGFYVPQVEEEIFKAKIIKHNAIAKEILSKTEANDNLSGNIASILRASYTKADKCVKDVSLSSCIPENFEVSQLKKILKGYEEMSTDGFIQIWGDTLNTEIYYYDSWRIRHTDDYTKHDSIIQLVLDYVYSEYVKIDDFAISIEKDFIRKMSNSTLSEIKDVKHQLYIYYILTVRIMCKEINDFFRKGYYFGFLPKEKHFSSLFNGINGNEHYLNNSPIYQTYSSQFRYNMGLQDKNALPPEIVGNGRINNPFEKLIEWSKE